MAVFRVIKSLVIVFIFTVLMQCSPEQSEKLPHQATDKAEIIYYQSPDLQRAVETGQLEPLSERLPVNPMLIQPDENIGSYGGTWRIGIRKEKNQGLLVVVFAYENLVRWNPEWTQVIPNVAQYWTVNEGSTEYIFHLRKGMKWSDGEPFSADDIEFYYEVMSDRELIPNGFPAWLTVQGEPVVIRKIDDYTVSFQFTAPYGLFLQRMATTSGAPVTAMPKHYLKQFYKKYNPDIIEISRKEGYETPRDLFYEKREFSSNPELPTLYAWIMEDSYTPLEKDVLRAVRNPFYWKVDSSFNQLPYIDSLEMVVCRDQGEVDRRILAGDFHMSINALPDNMLKEFQMLQEERNFSFFNTISGSMNHALIDLNLNHPDPVKRETFQNKNFRIALSYAIDRQRIIDDFYEGNGEPYQAAPRPESPFYSEQLARQYTEYNPELAVDHLIQGGFRKNDEGEWLDSRGNPIGITLIGADLFGENWPGVMEYIKKDWTALGIQVDVRIMTWQELDAQRNSARHDALIWVGNGGLDVILNPAYYFPSNSESGYAMSWMWWNSNTRFDFPREEPPEYVKKQMKLYKQLEATADEAEQKRLMSEILAISAEQFYTMGIALPGKSFGVTSASMKNVPSLFPRSWTYPSPAPTNPCQYYITE